MKVSAWTEIACGMIAIGVMTGCATKGAFGCGDEDPAIVTTRKEVIENYNAAKALVGSEEASQGEKSAKGCFYGVDRLRDMKANACKGNPFYDPKKEALSTAEGELSLVEIRERCRTMKDNFAKASNSESRARIAKAESQLKLEKAAALEKLAGDRASTVEELGLPSESKTRSSEDWMRATVWTFHRVVYSGNETNRCDITLSFAGDKITRVSAMPAGCYGTSH